MLQTVQEIKVARVKCQKNLMFHTRYFFKAQYNRKFVLGDHHSIIVEALERVLSGKCKRLILNVAPRYTKTELAVKSLITHGLSINPSSKYIHLSYSDDLALDNSESIKDVIQSAEYQQLFPEVQIKKDSRAKDKWYTTAGGGVLARAAAGQVTGFGAGKVDDPDADLEEFFVNGKEGFNGAIIIDDPIKPEDADQDTIREKVNSRFDSTIRNRVNSRDTPIIVIMQRLHPEDLSGYLQRDAEQDEWEVISLPCIKEDGTALWPFKHTIEELQKLEKTNDIVFQRQYMQNAKPKSGLMFPIDDCRMFNYKEMEEALDDADYCYLPVDPANLGGDSFAAPVLKLLGNKIYVTRVLFNKEGTDVNEPGIVKMAFEEKPGEIGIESIMGWAETTKRIKEELVEKGFNGEVRALRPRTNKHSRINSRSAFIRNHFYFRDDWKDDPQYAAFFREFTSYLKIIPPGWKGHDDAPDVLEMGAKYYERSHAHVNWNDF